MSEPHKFDERLNADKALIEAALENTGPGTRHNLLELKLRQIETALRIGGWVSSTGQPPKLLGRAAMKDMQASSEKLRN